MARVKMKTDFKKLPKGEVEFKIELSAEELERYRTRAARDLSTTRPVKGFRPGEAPVERVEEIVGREAFWGEVIQHAVREYYLPVFESHQLEPVGDPEITLQKAEPNAPLVFVIKSTVLPQISLPSYEKFVIEREEIKVADEEVDKALRTLQRARATFRAVERPAQKGDRVEIDFDSTVGGVSIEGGSSRQHPLIIGEGHFMHGFENELEGLHKGEEKQFSITAPKDYYEHSLRGRLVDFRVKMHVVEEVHPPEINDSFAQTLGKFPTLSALKESIVEGLRDEKKEKQKEKIRLKIVEGLITKSSFEVPESLVHREIETMLQEFSSALSRMGVSEESYLAHLKKSREELKKEWKDRAEKRVRAALLLRKIAEKEGVHVSEEEIEEKIGEILKNAPVQHEPEKINIGALREGARGMLRNEKVFSLLEKRVEFR